jgi:anti-repressor protein
VRGGAQRHRPRYLLKAEEAWNTPEPVVARALQALTKTLEMCHKRLTALEGENAELKAQNAASRPGAEYYERLVNAHGLTDLRDTAKELGIPERRFIEFPLQKKYVYRDRSGEIRPYAEYMKWFALKDEESGGRGGIRLHVTVAGKARFQNLVSDCVLFQAKACEFCRRN